MEAANSTKPSVMNKPPKSRRLLWVILSVVLVLGVFGLVLYQTGVLPKYFRSKDVVARVGNHYITKQEVQKTSEDAVKAGFYPESDKTIRNLIMDYWIYSLAAKEYNINVSDSEAVDYFRKTLQPGPLKDASTYNNSYVRYRAYATILQSKIFERATSTGKGSFVIGHFDQNLLRNTPALKALSNEQYDALLASDKKYATDFINDIYNKLKSGKIDMNKAMQLEIDDSKIGAKALPNLGHSSIFGDPVSMPGNTAGYLAGSNKEFKQKIAKLKPGELSEPFTMEVQLGPNESSAKVDGYWLVVKVDEFYDKGPKFDSANQTIEYFKKKYGYEIYL